MKRVLVTGATGFIGRHLVPLLAERGYQVSCLVRDPRRTRPIQDHLDRVRVGDLLDVDSLKRAVRGQDVVIHLAGLTKSLNRNQMRSVNVQGSHELAKACAACDPPPTLIHVSSMAAAGPATGNDQPRTESTPPAPVSHYGRTKLDGESAVAQFCQRVPTTILRPAIVLGEGDRDGLPIFEGLAWSGILVVPSFRDYIFSVIHVADLVRAIEFSITHGDRIDPARTRGTYFVTADEVLTYADLGRLIGRAMGRRRVHIIHSPTFSIWILAGLCELIARIRRKPYVMNFDKAREAVAGAWYCPSDSLKQLGFQFPVSLEQRMRQTAEWYWDQGWIPRIKPAREKFRWDTSSAGR